MRHSFTLLSMLLLAAVAGCGDFEEAMNSERQPVSPPGIAPVNQMDGDLDNIARGNGQANGAANGNAAQQNAPPAPPTEASIPKTEAKIVDKKAAMAANPNLVVVENKINGSDPLSVAASAYVYGQSRPQMLAFKHNLDVWKATEGRNPTCDEYQQMAKDMRFQPLRPYQMYGYDEEAGGLVILEDKAVKKQHFEEKGIPWEE